MEEVAVKYVFRIKTDDNEIKARILARITDDAGEEAIEYNADDDEIAVTFYEIDPDHGDNQSSYIWEWTNDYDWSNFLELDKIFY